MNPYEARQETRRDRLNRAAQKALHEGAGALAAADRLADAIPFGQPILVGHHSEARHRRDLDRIDRNMRKGFAAQERANELAARAAAVGTGGISSDDPDAVEKLRAELAHAEDLHARMLATNKAHKAFLRDPSSLDAVDLPETVKQRIRAFTPALSWQPHPIAPFELTNSSANVRRIKGRITELEARAAAAAAALEPTRETASGPGWRILEDLEDNRLRIDFAARVPRLVYLDLKRSGFRRSPSRGPNVWVRQLTNAARHAADLLVRSGSFNADTAVASLPLEP